jgi:hypothetical protein
MTTEEEAATSTCSASASGRPVQHHVSLLTSLCPQEPTTSRPLHVLVQGPSHSGRSSLAMDIAMEMASKMPCQCQIITSTSSMASTSTSTRSKICHCQPVALLRFDPKDNVHRFPLACHRVRRRRRQQQQQDQCTNMLEESTPTTSTRTTWTKQSLRRIQVHHATNLQSCLKFLLALQGRPHHQQPFGAIVMDDIDCLATMNHDNNDKKDYHPSRILSQVLAIVMDTINYLHSPPAVVCITINSTRTTKFSSPSSSYYAASFLNAIVTLQEDTSSTSSNKRALWNRICQQENRASLCSSWTATWVPRGLLQQHDTNKKSIAYGVVCHDHNGSFRIFWENEEVDGIC